MIEGYDIHITEVTRTRVIGYLTSLRSRANDFARKLCDLPTVKSVKVVGYDERDRPFVTFSYRKQAKPDTLQLHTEHGS